MNDRFRFRAWIVEKQEYVFDVESTWDDIEACFGDLINNTKYIVEQCTGLKDNCGNLIYEGDIIGDGEDDYVIKWDNNRTRFVAEDIDTSYDIEDVLDPTICVIGNIHEQPEQKDK